MLSHVTLQEPNVNSAIDSAPGTRRNLRWSLFFSLLSVGAYVAAPVTAYQLINDVSNEEELITGSIAIVTLLVLGRFFAIPQKRLTARATTLLGCGMFEGTIRKTWDLPRSNQKKGDARSPLVALIRANIAGSPDYFSSLYNHIYPAVMQQ